MSQPIVSLRVDDLIDELRQENKRLLNQLVFAEKCINLLEKFRTNLKSFNNYCKCDETLEYKINFNRLETKFKFFKQHFGHNYSKPLVIESNSVFKPKIQTKTMGIPLQKTSVHKVSKKFKIKEERDHRLKMIEIQRNIIRQIDLKKNRIQNNNSNKRVDTNDEISGDSECDSFKKINKMVENSSKLLEALDCMECDLKFNSKKRLIDHTKRSHNLYDNKSGIWKCNQSECSFQSDRFRNLTLHKYHHLGKKPFLCDWPGCEAGFFRNTHLVVHRGSHEGIRKYKCEWPSCEQSFRSKCNLKYHYNSHTGEKPYKCEWPGCDARFSTQSSKTRHKVVHSMITGYRCDWKDCGKSFKFKGSLNRHYILHESDKSCLKRVKCQSIGCDIRFINKRQMTDHFKQIHN